MLIHENFMMNENWGVKVRKLNLWPFAHEYGLYVEALICIERIMINYVSRKHT